jgi:hypothetical protein
VRNNLLNRTVLFLLLAISMPAVAQKSVEDTLAQMDKSLVCPETLASDEARDAALRKFMTRLQRDVTGITVGQALQFRMYMLERHGCTRTLENIRKNSKHQPTLG